MDRYPKWFSTDSNPDTSRQVFLSQRTRHQRLRARGRAVSSLLCGLSGNCERRVSGCPGYTIRHRSRSRQRETFGNRCERISVANRIRDFWWSRRCHISHRTFYTSAEGSVVPEMDGASSIATRGIRGKGRSSKARTAHLSISRRSRELGGPGRNLQRVWISSLTVGFPGGLTTAYVVR